ncbi:MAG: alpha/beta fold hydrolase, partial [Acidobacteriota bacterium]
TYRFPDGSAVIIGSRFWGELLYTNLETGRHGTLFPRSASEFFAGSAMYVPGPITAEATFRRGAGGEVTGLTWTERGKPARSGARAPLVEEEVSFAGAAVPLAGTLIRPEGPGRFPAVVVLGGSNWDVRGSIRRDAEIFAALGVAALIYDKRGYGQSGGDPTVPFRTTAEDAAAAVRHLRGRPDILADQIGLTGTSRGGWFAPLAASISDDASFLVLFVPPAVSPAEQETTRRLNRMRDEGADESAIELAGDLLERTWAYARTGEGWQEYLDLRRRAVEVGVPDYVFETDSPDPEAWEWVRLNMHYDPIPALETLRIPVLALFGGADRNVDPEINEPRMRAALERAGNGDFELVVLPGADHGLRLSRDGGPVPLHRTIGFAPGRWSTVRTWLVAHLPGLRG